MRGPVKRVMIVDDHIAVRRGICALLKGNPQFTVVAEAGSGRAALAEARRANPDIAILDYAVPELNGCDLTVSLKRELPDLQVLIYTVYSGEQIFGEALRAGARGFVTKFEPVDHLLHALKSLAAGQPYFNDHFRETLLAEYLKDKEPFNFGGLTPRERETLQLVAEGRCNKAVAKHLKVSLKTVECHRMNVMRKLKVTTVAELVRYAVRVGMIEV